MLITHEEIREVLGRDYGTPEDEISLKEYLLSKGVEWAMEAETRLDERGWWAVQGEDKRISKLKDQIENFGLDPDW